VLVSLRLEEGHVISQPGGFAARLCHVGVSINYNYITLDSG
jgi:hypothetical protein